MPATALFLLSYSLLALLAVLALTGARSYFIVIQGRPADSFDPAGTDVPAWLHRLTRVYANLSESAPLVLLVPIVALATQQSHVTDGLSWFFLAARLAQMTVHLVSDGDRAVRVRYAFFLVQVGIVAYWLWQFATMI